MRIADYKCKDCDFIFEGIRKDFEEWPINLQCPKCGSKNTIKKFGKFVSGVAEGKCGNASTGYSTGIVSHPSKFGKFKGNSK